MEKRYQIFAGLFLVFALVVSGCSTEDTSSDLDIEDIEIVDEIDNEDSMLEETDTREEITTDSEGILLSEVANHGLEDDCWLAIEGKVYNVTDFIASHPGGKAILSGCGKDATEMYAKHPESARDLLPDFYIGDLAE